MSRYRYNSGGVILDLKRDMSYYAGDITDLLEGKDIHIRKLEEENQQLREDLQAKDILVNTYMLVVGTLDNAKQLKQSQKQLAIEELEKTLVIIQNAVNLESPEYDLVGLYDVIVRRIKELKGEE